MGPLAVAALTLLILGCTQAAAPLDDSQISLRQADLLTTTEPAPLRFAGADPGENKKLERGYFGAPPMIPHSIADAVISLGTNDCVDCHEEGDEDTPGLPPSHKLKPRIEVLSRAQAHQGQVTRVAGYDRVEAYSANRYDCLLCHAPQAADTPPLVDNTFIFEKPTDTQKDSLEGLRSVGPN